MSASHQREAAIFDAAMELPPEQRAAHLDQACGGDAALRQRMEALLKAGESSCGFLDSPTDPPMAVGPTNVSPPSLEKAGDTIGRYKLLQQIGEGGCGVVYMAEQTDPVRRRVALKIVKLGMDTKSVIARFEAERQALALMDHPNIAKVFDAGSTERPLTPSLSPGEGEGARRAGEGESGHPRPSDGRGAGGEGLSAGRPYFVMELVRGMKITDYCDEAKLSTRARLDLFIQVCDAIQHAHQKGIIHRDIKPSNILVTINDGVPVPKVIDFGIAKATGGQQLTNKTVFTAFEQFIGTPAYMSPEQAVLTSLDIDTRSDIYALGVLLYELLTGRTPFDAKELLSIGLDEMRRTIREQEPPRPSTRLSTLPGQELSTTAQRRGLEAPKLVSELRGDLDWIIMKALEKDRTRRYETANGLAMDIHRHLSNEPVVACPPSKLYRFQKWIRRNKLVFVAGAAVVAALLFGLGTSTWMFFQERAALRRAVTAEQSQKRLRQEAETARGRAQADEKKALTEASKSQQVAQFLQDMLKGVGPSVAGGRDTTILKEILDQTAERLDKELAKQPEIEAELRNTIGCVYFELGQYGQAQAMYERSLVLIRQAFGNDDVAVADTLHNLAELLRHIGRTGKAVENERQAVAIYEKLFGRQCGKVGISLNNLGFALINEGKRAEAVAVLQEALAINRKAFGDGHPEVGLSLSRLGRVLERRDQLDEAESVLRDAVRIQKNALGGGQEPGLVAPEVELGWTLLYLSRVVGRKGDWPQAERLDREAVATMRKVLGKNHPDVSAVVDSLLSALVHQGKLTEAKDLAGSRSKLAEVLAAHGEWNKAAEIFDSLVQEAPTNHLYYHSLAPLRIASGDLKKYRRCCKEIVARFGDTTNPNVGDRMAKDCSILPSSRANLEVVSRMADVAATPGSSNRFFAYFQCTKGLAEYRQGHFENAVNRADKTIAIREHPGNYYWDDTLYLEAYAVSAMARFQLNQTDAARATLAEAKRTAARLAKLGKDDLGPEWRDWIIAHKLLDETTALIEDASETKAEAE
jgi:eukaryotic-like serine/threonine-protein kinase